MEGVEEVEEGDLTGIGGDGGCFERGRRFVGVKLDETDEGVGTGGKEVVLDDAAEENLHDDCFEGGNGLFA